MVVHLNLLPTAVFLFVLLCWFAFAAIFLVRKKPPKPAEQKRDRASIAGIALQGLSYAIVWSLRRPLFTPIWLMPKAVEIAAAVLTAAIAVASVWICLAAIRTLGKQWAFVARVVEGHKLITDGPYSLVRNPIYTGMFGMLVATGLALSVWWALLAAIVIFLIGNRIRITAEEKLLRESFGEEFEEYARRVPAFLPRLF
jgi:protein-S-isoprenylcysteine O-methyltransferase Ste14